MLWFRIDNRLVHGQVIETWLPYVEADLLLVVNDAIAVDPLQQSIMSLAVPARVDIEFLPVKTLAATLHATTQPDILILFADCQDARKAFEDGCIFKKLNIGNLHYASGKRQICVHVAVSPEDEKCLAFFRDKGVELDFRSVPNDKPRVDEFGA